jgi:hypothetical protein
MKKSLSNTLLFAYLVASGNLYAQSEALVSKPNYPYVKGYLSFIIP